MNVIDLTLQLSESPSRNWDVAQARRTIRCGERDYTAEEYEFRFVSGVATYIDFPGHIVETDDGLRAGDWPLNRLFRVRCAVAHLDRADESGGVGAAELEAACPVLTGCGGLVINALGARRFDAIRNRSVWLTPDATGWIVRSGIKLFVSDIYERAPELTGVFCDLFDAGIAAVCQPVNLHLLTTSYVELSALPIRVDAAQVPCRVVAELTDAV